MPDIFTAAAPLRADAAGTAAAVPITAIEPEGTARGGIVVLYSSAEHTGTRLELLRALADDGWIAVAPNIFHRGDPPDTDALFADFDGCFDWLTARGVFPDCVGVLGFDIAGTAAFLVATSRAVGAAVSVAARGIATPLTPHVPSLIGAVGGLRAPWLGLYGESDPETPPEHIAQLDDALGHASVAANIVVYPGLRHRADEGQSSEEINGAQVDAQTRIFDWFDSNLR